jgi:hypothetical protein
MANSQVLSAEQISFFKENGYLILENCIEPELLATWQEQFWWCLNSRFDDPDSWPTDQISIQTHQNCSCQVAKSSGSMQFSRIKYPFSLKKLICSADKTCELAIYPPSLPI